MLDMLIELAMDNADLVLDVLFGAAATVVAYKVVQVINPDNVKDLIREAIKSSRQKSLEKFIGKAVEATIKEKKSNAISLELFCAECGETSRERILLESTRGVDSSLKKGTKILVNVC